MTLFPGRRVPSVMGLIQKNDSVPDGAITAGRDSKGGYSHVSKGP
jgi:hypothetical protein